VNVLAPVRYAELLDGLGASEQSVRLQIYAHRLASTAEVAEWVKGSTLTRVRRAADDDDTYAAFLDRYRRRLVDTLGDRAPYTYFFQRILFWARV
jgi:trans-aconitate 2-methyltransferase